LDCFVTSVCRPADPVASLHQVQGYHHTALWPRIDYFNDATVKMKQRHHCELARKVFASSEFLPRYIAIHQHLQNSTCYKQLSHKGCTLHTSGQLSVVAILHNALHATSFTTHCPATSCVHGRDFLGRPLCPYTRHGAFLEHLQ
jgi:hypothetical protein